MFGLKNDKTAGDVNDGGNMPSQPIEATKIDVATPPKENLVTPNAPSPPGVEAEPPKIIPLHGDDSDDPTPASPAPPPPPPSAAPDPTPENPSPPPPAAQAAPGDSDDLTAIKRQSLEQLAPLIDKLDQTPQERFRTIMMYIQESNNPRLVKAAFDTANKIADEKQRAQALLDVVNEINYLQSNG